LADTYLPHGLFHWDQALTRVALGVFMEGIPSGRDEFYATESAGPYLPLETRDDESAGAAWFIRTARALAADVREIKSHRLSIPEWAHMMREMITRYITVSSPHEEEALNRYHDALDEVVRMGIEGHPVGYEVAHALTADIIAEIQLRSSTFTGRGVAVGSLTA